MSSLYNLPHKRVDMQMRTFDRLVAKKLLQFCVRLLFFSKGTPQRLLVANNIEILLKFWEQT